MWLEHSVFYFRISERDRERWRKYYTQYIKRDMDDRGDRLKGMVLHRRSESVLSHTHRPQACVAVVRFGVFQSAKTALCSSRVFIFSKLPHSLIPTSHPCLLFSSLNHTSILTDCLLLRPVQPTLLGEAPCLSLSSQHPPPKPKDSRIAKQTDEAVASQVWCDFDWCTLTLAAW